ncbi:MAG: hypothetical protein CMF96_09140 [Candidatus Marinimicrobia bacterium]|mgnify:CR=1 FL=1|nr:hypothetical protein [Candidatus Neomarinimicrobiota bacterium]|tara:strand:- start:800 stop:1018 length:219 start_codon:yes stop_codon:yes gene_type:complete
MKKIILNLSIIFSFIHTQTYDTGDIMSSSHQNQSFDVCYGDYNSTFSFSDLNGASNSDGKYWISFIDMAATW